MTLNSCLVDFNDFRELVPEFFYFPEIFLNMNQVNFGIRQDKIKVHHINLPPWGMKNPYRVIVVHR